MLSTQSRCAVNQLDGKGGLNLQGPRGLGSLSCSSLCWSPHTQAHQLFLSEQKLLHRIWPWADFGSGKPWIGSKPGPVEARGPASLAIPCIFDHFAEHIQVLSKLWVQTSHGHLHTAFLTRCSSPVFCVPVYVELSVWGLTDGGG